MSHSHRRKKVQKEQAFFTSRRKLLNTLLALLGAVITGAAATLIGEWAVDRWITSSRSQIALLEVGTPKNEEIAFLSMVARSPFVGNDDQHRFVIEGVEPFNLGMLSVRDLPYVDLPVRLANVGEKPTTVTSFFLTFYTQPSSLRAAGYPFPSDDKTVLLDAGQTVDMTIRFQFGDLRETKKIPESPVSLGVENLEAVGMLELSIIDVKEDHIVSHIEFKVGQTYPDHKLFTWFGAVEGEKRGKLYGGVLPLSHFNSRTNPALAHSYVRLGDEYYEQQVYHEAIEAFTVAIGLDNQDSHAYYRRGNAWDEIDELESAISDYTRAASLDPENWEALSNLGYVYVKLGNYQKAEESLQSAIAVMPQEPIPYLNLGAVYIVTGQYESAVEFLTQAILLDPNNAQAYHYRSIAYMGLGEEKQSRRDLEQATRLGWDEDSHGDFEMPYALTPTPDS